MFMPRAQLKTQLLKMTAPTLHPHPLARAGPVLGPPTWDMVGMGNCSLEGSGCERDLSSTQPSGAYIVGLPVPGSHSPSSDSSLMIQIHTATGFRVYSWR